MNHAIADGYLFANVFRLLEKEILDFVIWNLRTIKERGIMCV